MRKLWMAAAFVLALAVAYGDSQTTNQQNTNSQTAQKKAEKKTATETPASTVTPSTAQSETTNNTAGSIAGNAGAIGTTTGDTKPTNANVQQQSAAGNNAPAGNATQTIENSPSAPQNTKPESANGAPSATGMTFAADTDAKTLQGEIDSALKSDPALANSQLNVNVDDSQITLTGTVPTGKEKVTATRIAQSYAGNRRVQDKVSIAGRQQKPEAATEQPNAVGTNPKKQ